MYPNLDLKHLASLVIKEIKALKGDNRLDITNIRNGEQLAIKANRKEPDQRYHGAGDTVEAGNGITITSVDGKKVISTDSSSFTFIDNEIVESLGNRQYQLAYNPILNSQHIYCISTGERYFPDQSYTIAGSIVTVGENVPEPLGADYRTEDIIP